MNLRRPADNRRFLGGYALVSVLLGAVLCLFAPGGFSWAVTEEIEAKISEAQQQIESSAAAYDTAVARVEELTAQAAENENRIAQLKEELPLQQERSDEAMVTLYKMNREGNSLLDMVLSSENILVFLQRVDYLARVQARNLDVMRALSAMEQELADTQAALDAALDEAEEQQRQAELSLSAAQQAREQAQKEAQEQARREREAQEAARKAAEEAAAAEQKADDEKAGEEKAGDESNDKSTDKTEEKPAEKDKGSSAPSKEEEPPSTSPSNDGANWGADKQAFVNQWAGRINSYLAGSAMAGKGAVFAAAAWDYGVDPRWSPAIAEVESGRGASCFRPHNAWGWGSASWGSWDEAIQAHVAGLARGYGYTLTEDAAKRYCPSSWQHWYSRCAAEMNSI